MTIRYFSHWDNICKPYNYSGCGANLNHFLSEEDNFHHHWWNFDMVGVCRQVHIIIINHHDDHDYETQTECLHLCPPKKFTGHEPRCKKLRERGNCTNKQVFKNYFYVLLVLYKAIKRMRELYEQAGFNSFNVLLCFFV